MPDAFVPLRAWLRPPTLVEDIPEAQAEPEPLPELPLIEEDEAPDAIDAAIREAKRFRAALSDALSGALDALLADIASDVLARELQIAPCDLQRIVERALQRYGSHVLCVRVHPSEAALAGGEWHVESDPRMRCGDVEVVLSSGTIDARLGARLSRVLAEARA